jgi:DNA primase
MDHVSAIGDPNVRQLYRDEWLRKFDALVRPQPQLQGRSLYPRREWKKGKDGRFAPPPAPASAAARAISSAGIDKTTARALVLGHALYPDAIGDHVEALAALPIADKAASKLRDRMVDLIMSGQMLDRPQLTTILAAEETAAAWRDVSKGGDIGFSFTRTKSDPAIARRDLGLAIETLMAKVEIEAAFETAMSRFKAGDEAAFEEQQRLHAAREVINERLASLASNE